MSKGRVATENTIFIPTAFSDNISVSKFQKSGCPDFLWFLNFKNQNNLDKIRTVAVHTQWHKHKFDQFMYYTSVHISFQAVIWVQIRNVISHTHCSIKGKRYYISKLLHLLGRFLQLRLTTIPFTSRNLQFKTNTSCL